MNSTETELRAIHEAELAVIRHLRDSLSVEEEDRITMFWSRETCHLIAEEPYGVSIIINYLESEGGPMGVDINEKEAVLLLLESLNRVVENNGWGEPKAQLPKITPG